MRDVEQAASAIAFGMVDGIGPATARRLLSSFDTPEAVLGASRKELRKIHGLSQRVISGLTDKRLLPHATEEARKLTELGGRVTYLGGPGYPNRLTRCIDPPVVLFQKGNADLNHKRILAIVGTRRISPYGAEVCDWLISALQQHNVMVVSGLAFGVDIHAHRAALRNNLPTVACLAHGLDKIYPGVHKKEADRMKEHGALVTEFRCGTRPKRENFPSRNRIIAGLSDAVIVVESANKGGSMITARIAASYHREVFAVPGPLFRETSEGCNQLIAGMEAQMLNKVSQIATELGWETPGATEKQLELRLELPDDQRAVCEVLQEHGTRHIDLLRADLEDSVPQLAAVLLQMELGGLIRHLPGQRFSLAK